MENNSAMETLELLQWSLLAVKALHEAAAEEMEWEDARRRANMHAVIARIVAERGLDLYSDDYGRTAIAPPAPSRVMASVYPDTILAKAG